MPIPLQCSCGRRLNLADNLCGKRIKCPDCAAILTVPTAQVSLSARNQAAKIQPAKKSPEKGPPEAQPKTIIISGRSASAELEQIAPPPPTSKPEPVKPAPAPAKPAPAKPGAAKAGATAKPAASKPAAAQPSTLPKTPPPPRPAARDAEDYDEELFADVPISGGLFASREDTDPRYTRRRKGTPWLLIGGGAAGLLLIAMIGYGLLTAIGGDPPASAFAPEAAVANAGTKLIPPPHPALTLPVGNGVMTGSTSYQDGLVPGGATQLQVYMPPGEHAEKSLGCVLVAPAGTNLLVGSAIDDLSYHDEALPYAEAGYLTIKYSIDGGVGDLEAATDNEIVAGYKKFRDAHYGVINTQRAIDFAETYPEVDRTRIYVAGHSSAGTLALLAAVHEPRVRGCIAYAPCSDVESFHGDLQSNLAMRFLFPDLQFVCHDSSPMTYADQLKCPLFLFHAQDDSVVKISDTQSFAQQVRSHNSSVELYEVPYGEHYDSMIQQGIPRALLWLQQQKP